MLIMLLEVCVCICKNLCFVNILPVTLSILWAPLLIAFFLSNFMHLKKDLIAHLRTKIEKFFPDMHEIAWNSNIHDLHSCLVLLHRLEKLNRIQLDTRSFPHEWRWMENLSIVPASPGSCGLWRIWSRREKPEQQTSWNWSLPWQLQQVIKYYYLK